MGSQAAAADRHRHCIYTGPPSQLLKMPGYWRRPIARVYSYNLDLGETYYSPMKDYLERERGETPGALTYSERIARTWCGGDKDRQMRAKTEAFERESIREAIRATSEVRREVTPQVEVDYSTINSASQKAEEVLNTHRRMIREISEDTQRRVQEINPRYEDNVSRKAMTYRSYSKPAADLAADAMRDDALLSSSHRRTKRVTYESTRRPIF